MMNSLFKYVHKIFKLSKQIDFNIVCNKIIDLITQKIWANKVKGDVYTKDNSVVRALVRKANGPGFNS